MLKEWLNYLSILCTENITNSLPREEMIKEFADEKCKEKSTTEVLQTIG